MSNLSLKKVFISQDIKGLVSLAIVLRDFKTDVLIDSSSRTVNFTGSYTFNKTFQQSLFQPDSIFKVSYFITELSDEKRIFNFGDDLYYTTPDFTYVPTKFKFKAKEYGSTSNSPPLFSLDVNYESLKTLEPNPSPFSFDRYDVTKMFEDDSVTFDNTENFSPKFEPFQISNKKLKRINLSKANPFLEIISYERVGYESMEISIIFGIEGPYFAYKDKYYIDVIKNGVRINRSTYNVNKTSKNLVLSQLEKGDSIRFNLVLKEDILKTTRTITFKVNKDESKLEKVISYDF